MTTDKPTAKILYIDDEEKSLKYFLRFFSGYFNIVTATSAQEGREIIESDPTAFGVIISDQRMPEERGVSILSWVRRNHPNIIRLLTTGYSDLDEAIQSVNEGAIYEYVTKPWNTDSLRMSLKRALDLHAVRQDRDLLIREKVSALQHAIVADRSRNLAIIASALSYRLRNPLQALQSFLEHMPEPVAQETTIQGSIDWKQLWNLARSQSEQISTIVDTVLSDIVHVAVAFNDNLDIKNLSEVMHASIPTIQIEQSDTAAETTCLCDLPMIEKLIASISSCFSSLEMSGPFHASFTNGSRDGAVKGISFQITADTQTDSTYDESRLYQTVHPVDEDGGHMSAGYLLAYFVVYHHGGKLHIVRKDGQFGFEIFLPCQPESQMSKRVDQEWLDRIMTILD